MTTYRLDRRFVLPVVGLCFIGAGVAAALAFLLWPPLGVLAAVVLLYALWLYAIPPVVVRVDHSGMRIGGRLGVRPLRVVWTDVEDVGVERGDLVVSRGDQDSFAFPLAFVGERSGVFVRDVYDRLNTAHGYRRFDPS